MHERFLENSSRVWDGSKSTTKEFGRCSVEIYAGDGCKVGFEGEEVSVKLRTVAERRGRGESGRAPKFAGM